MLYKKMKKKTTKITKQQRIIRERWVGVVFVSLQCCKIKKMLGSSLKKNVNSPTSSPPPSLQSGGANGDGVGGGMRSSAALRRCPTDTPALSPR